MQVPLFRLQCGMYPQSLTLDRTDSVTGVNSYDWGRFLPPTMLLLPRTESRHRQSWPAVGGGQVRGHHCSP